MASLHAAFRHGYGAEIDVQLSADGQVVVFHDTNLYRLTGVRGRLASRTAGHLSRLCIKGGVEHPPLLAEALDGLPMLPLLIELKMGNRALAPAVARLLDNHEGPFAIQSFDPHIVAWFRENRPDWPRGLIAFQKFQFGLNAVEPRFRPDFLDICDPHFAAWYVKDLPPPTKVVSRVPILTWTVRSAADRRLASKYARNIIFEGFRA